MNQSSNNNMSNLGNANDNVASRPTAAGTTSTKISAWRCDVCRNKSFRCSKKAFAHEQECALLKQQEGAVMVTTDDDDASDENTTSAENNQSKRRRRRSLKRRSVAAPENDTASRGRKKAKHNISRCPTRSNQKKKQPKKKEYKRVPATPKQLTSIKTILNRPSELDRYWPKLDDSVKKTLKKQADQKEQPPRQSPDIDRRDALFQCAQELEEPMKEIWPKEFPECQDGASRLAHQYYDDSIPWDGRVNLLVLAESHARTSEATYGAKMSETTSIPQEARDLHHGHLNLVHCLTYGEDHLLDETVEVDGSAKMGTFDFWKVFGVLAGALDEWIELLEDGVDINEIPDVRTYTEQWSKGHTTDEERIQNKIDLLKRLKDLGIVLADISPFSIYPSGGSIEQVNKTTGKTYWTPKHSLAAKTKKELIKTAYLGYAKPLIETLRPKYILVLGVSGFQIIKEAGLMDVCEAVGAEVLGCTMHPSHKQSDQAKRMRLLRQIHNAGKLAEAESKLQRACPQSS